MAREKTETRSLMLMALLALWLAAWVYSVFVLLIPGDRISTSGLGPVAGFLGWQGVAGMIAFGCWGIGVSFPKGSGIRRVSAVPLAMAAALILVGAGMAVFGGSLQPA